MTASYSSPRNAVSAPMPGNVESITATGASPSLRSTGGSRLADENGSASTTICFVMGFLAPAGS
jgi:hypothetical protein